MKESLDSAIKELKRVDHLYYVSLKYTRTADMMKHVIERLINVFSHCIDALLKQAKDEKKIDEIPSNLGLKAKLVLDTFPDEEIKRYIHLYSRLRKIIRADYSKREEFRRHVTMSATINNGEIAEVNIDILKEYYDKSKDFVKLIRNTIYGEEPL